MGRSTSGRSSTNRSRRSFTAIIAFAIKYTLGWRIDEEDEVDGIDFAQHGESAYDFVSLSSGSRGTPTAIAQSDAESRGVNA